MLQTERKKINVDRVLQIVVLVYQCIALVVFLSAILQSLPARIRSMDFILSFIIGLVLLGIGLWIFGLRHAEAAGRAFAVFSSSAAISVITLFVPTSRDWLDWSGIVAVILGAAALIDLALIFPQQAGWTRRRPYLRWMGYGVSLLLFILAALYRYGFQFPIPATLLRPYIYGYGIFSGIFFTGMVLYRLLAAHSPVIRQQSGAILVAILVAFGPIALWSWLGTIPTTRFPAWFQGLAFLFSPNISPFLLILTILYPLVLGYSILRARLVRTDLIFRQSVLYALLTVLALIGYALLVSGFTLIFGQAFRVTNPFFIGLLVFLLALGLNPLRNRLQRFVNNVFFRNIQAYEDRVRGFSHAMTDTVNLAVIVRTLRQTILGSLLPDLLHIYVYDPINDWYAASLGEDGRPTSDVRFPSASPLIELLHRSKLPIFLSPQSLPAELKTEGTRLAVLKTSLLVPFPGSDRPTGWLALGSRHSGEIYRAQDLGFLEEISAAAALAIERAQVIDKLERRVREMDILARVAQGVNVTVAFDDILELIYAQTTQALPADDFHITLFDKENQYYYFAFCVEKDDRVSSLENLPLPAGTGLSPEVICSRRGILTADYSRECQLRGIKVQSEGIHAWTGVPLNTGAETIGALSVGNRNASLAYTTAQQQLLQSIAEQAAGAIIKARLFQEAERRAHQLSILNDITRQLTGTLETEPLMQKILDSAVSILNCGAGTLFLVDETSNELVFKATAGPLSHNPTGQRLSPGMGIASQAVQSRTSLVSNNGKDASAWLASTGQPEDSGVHSVLAVPLQVKGNVIGVLEMIDRKDGLPFVEDDQNLLSAFAGQAAVAIDNARLYTLTDQALNARVEELSVMQRVDRELNASLDVARAMRLTLEWAMRQSGAEAGLIGVLEAHGIRLMAQQGYDKLEQTNQNSLIPLDQFAIHTAVETGQLQRLLLDDQMPGLLDGAKTQTVVPIRREAKVIGLIVMESCLVDPQSSESMPFLTRLSDHAAIAIANAQLYSEVQAANEAKSEFVSFVAHELKNPMTSIKGYTELIAKGAVGSISDMQANFLGTIHSNVERMSTLVSDLNDNSKIEAGRLRLDFKAISIAEAVEEVMRSTKRQLEDKKQSADMEIPANLPQVWADSTRLVQIMINLVSNANKYTPESGRICVGAEQSANKWDKEGASQVVHIWVKDNGIGISLDDQKKIFGKFFRSDDSKAREAPGTGLGLNITKSLIEMMGGRVWFESEFRQGTTFHFTVPVAEG